MSHLGTLLIDLSVANAKADRVLRKLYEDAIEAEYDFENEEIDILRNALGFDKKPVAPMLTVSGPTKKPVWKKPEAAEVDHSITDPQKLLDAAASFDPLATLEGLRVGSTNIDHLHRAELIAVAHVLGAVESDTAGKTIKVLRSLVGTLLEANAIAPSAPTVKNSPKEKPITRIPFRLPKHLGHKATGKTH